MLERVLIVGLGSIGRRHATLVREVVPGVQIVALRRQLSGAGAEERIDRIVTTMSEALALRPQAAVIANPATLHIDAALQLAQAGVHLLIEKPLSSGIDRVSELIELCRERRLVLMTGYNLRFLPSLRLFRQLLREQRIGRVLSVRAETGQHLPSWRPGADYRQSVSASSALGGGVLLELSHEIDYLRWIFGNVAWVGASLSKQSSLEIDVEDTAHLTLGFAQQGEQPAVIGSLNIDFIRHDSVRICTAIGENGSLRWDAMNGSVEVFERGDTAWHTLMKQKHDRNESYLAEWSHFVQCIATGSQPEISGEDGLAVLEIIEAARRSSVRRATEII